MLFTTFIGPQASGCFETLSSRIVCENAGHGEECSNFDMLENNSWPHSEHTYIPENEERGTVLHIFTAECLVTQPQAASHFLSLTRLEVIFIFFTTRKRAVRHFIHFSQKSKSSEPKQFISTVAQLRPEKPLCAYQVSAAPWLLCNARSFSHCFHLVAIFWKTKMHTYLPSFTNTGTKNSSTKWI